MTGPMSWADQELAFSLLQTDGRFNAVLKRALAGELTVAARWDFAEELDALSTQLRVRPPQVVDPAPTTQPAVSVVMRAQAEVIDELRSLHTVFNAGLLVMLEGIRERGELHRMLVRTQGLLDQCRDAVASNIALLDREA